MTILNLFAVLFFLGVLIEASIVLINRHSPADIQKFLLYILMAPLFALTLFKRGQDQSVYLSSFLTVTSIGFAVLFAIGFKNKILPIITEINVLVFTVIFQFFLFTKYGASSIIFYLALIPSIAVFMVNMVKNKPPYAVKLILYVWYLISITVLTGFILHNQLSTDFNLFLNHSNLELLPYLSPFSVLLTGMSFLYLVSHLTYLIALIPITLHRKTTLRQRWIEVKNHALILTQKYKHKNTHPLVASLLIVLGLGGSLTLNYYFQWIDIFTSITFSVVIIAQLIEYKQPFKK